jgi:hypothetical protein
MNHYCDIELPVQERREWAKGSLGGYCMCDRCRREAKEEEAANGVAAVVSMVSDMSIANEISRAHELSAANEQPNGVPEVNGIRQAS